MLSTGPRCTEGTVYISECLEAKSSAGEEPATILKSFSGFAPGIRKKGLGWVGV